jgi:hypothetical protein
MWAFSSLKRMERPRGGAGQGPLWHVRPSHVGSPPKRLGGLAPSRVAPWQSISPGKALTLRLEKTLYRYRRR